LIENEARYRRLVEGAPDVVYTFSSKRGGIYYSPHVEQILGYSPDYLYAHPWLWNESIHPEDRAQIDSILRDFGDEKPFDCEYRIKDANGNWRWLRDRSIGRICADGDELLIEGLATDITERKLASQNLQDSLAEKDVLLREVHHRVKNNLASIIGLIGLQHSGQDDPKLKLEFTELSSRIQAMALVHELLYRSDVLNWVDMQAYLEALTSQLRTAYRMHQHIQITVSAQGARTDLDTAIPCGLIVTELLTNTFKYAFPNGQPRQGEQACRIAVSYSSDGDICTLGIRDNGVGLPAGLDWEKSPTLGLRLIRMLGQHQLGATVQVDTSAGTRFELKFAEIRGVKK
jgi:PAS domain S-box-containing protein